MKNSTDNGAALPSHELFSELFRVDSEIRKMRHALLIANRLKDSGRWQSKDDGELRELRKKLTAALLERSKLDDRIFALNSVLSRPDL